MNTTSIAAATSFPIPFTLDQLREDILNLYLLQLRNISLFASENKVSELAGVDLNELHSGDIQARTFGLTYEAIQNTDFAKAMEQQYSFAFLGVDNMLCDGLYSDSKHTWVAAFIHDLKSSATVAEWGQYDATFDVRRCLHTCELANARNVLEGQEKISSYINAYADDDNQIETEGALTIHQMALLSGMEEMTIRTAISRPSANRLPFFKDAKKRTLITIKDAKEWLIAKGRYIPVSTVKVGGQKINLEKTCFKNTADFTNAVFFHLQFMTDANSDINVYGKVADLNFTGMLFRNREDLLNFDLMTEAAKILELPPSLFALRAKEAVLHQDMAELNYNLAAEKASLKS